MKKIILTSLIVVLALGVSNLQATELSGIAGAFADVGLGLRPLGMGGAYSALAYDENAARWNPSLLGEVIDPVAGFSWNKQFNLISYNYLSVAYPIGQNGLGLGAFVVTTGDDIYSETTIGLASGIPGDYIGITDMLRLGGTVKIYMTDYGKDADGGIDRVDGSSTGFGLDLAASVRFSDEFLISLVARDLVNSISWKSSVGGSYSEGVPRVVSLGAGFQDDQMAISCELQPPLYSDVPLRFGVGAELVMLKVLRPRVGMSQNFGAGDPNRWITVGLGIDFAPTFMGPIHQVKFGYTHMIHDIDATPRVGLTLGW
jgi:hypothetical protein